MKKLLFIIVVLFVLTSCATNNEENTSKENNNDFNNSITFNDEELKRTYVLEQNDDFKYFAVYDENNDRVSGIYLSSYTKVNDNMYVLIEGKYNDSNKYESELLILFDNDVKRYSLMFNDVPKGFINNQNETYETNLNEDVLEIYSSSSYVKGYFNLKDNTYSMEYLIDENILTEDDYAYKQAKIKKIDDNTNFIQLMGSGGGDGSTLDVYVKDLNNIYYLGAMPTGTNNGYGTFKNKDIYLMTSSSFDVYKNYKLTYSIQDYVSIGNIDNSHYNYLVAVQRINDNKYLLIYIPNFSYEEVVSQNVAKATYHLVELENNKITKDIDTNINADFSMWGPYSVFMSTNKGSDIVTVEVKNNEDLRHSFKIDINNEEVFDYAILDDSIHMK